MDKTENNTSQGRGQSLTDRSLRALESRYLSAFKVVSAYEGQGIVLDVFATLYHIPRDKTKRSTPTWTEIELLACDLRNAPQIYAETEERLRARRGKLSKGDRRAAKSLLQNIGGLLVLFRCRTIDVVTSTAASEPVHSADLLGGLSELNRDVVKCPTLGPRTERPPCDLFKEGVSEIRRGFRKIGDTPYARYFAYPQKCFSDRLSRICRIESQSEKPATPLAAAASIAALSHPGEQRAM